MKSFHSFRPESQKVSEICKSIPCVPKTWFSAADKERAELSNVAIGRCGCMQLLLFAGKTDAVLLA
jgi:hypothetical protein